MARPVLCVSLAVRDGEDSVLRTGCVLPLAVRDGEEQVVCVTSSEGW